MSSPLSFPLYTGKHALPALTDPAEHAAYVRRRHPGADLTGTAGAILAYQRSLATEAVRRGAQPLGRWVSGDLHLTHDNVVVCSGFGRGAPAAGLVLEQLIALGARAVITVGTAATLHRGLKPGDLVICEEALRDEGLSHHYLAPARYVAPDVALTARLAAELATQGAHHRGRTWSTDALYRETAAEVSRYSAEGILTADMEAAGVLAVAQHRQVPVAAAFTIADSLAQRTPRADTPQTAEGLGALLHAAARALAKFHDDSPHRS
ncbi:purine-nucleoside phosphorylase [Streptomyces griseocarneus]|nr:purine-nucleoside phosphorylase [Streptomyces griseocarneus]